MKKSLGKTDGEKIVNNLCNNTFLKLWSWANLYNGKGQELCDTLIIFNKTIIIISEKSIEFELDKIKEKGIDICWNRWKHNAWDKSENQLYGAERILKEQPNN